MLYLSNAPLTALFGYVMIFLGFLGKFWASSVDYTSLPNQAIQKFTKYCCLQKIHVQYVMAHTNKRFMLVKEVFGDSNSIIFGMNQKI